VTATRSACACGSHTRKRAPRFCIRAGTAAAAVALLRSAAARPRPATQPRRKPTADRCRCACSQESLGADAGAEFDTWKEGQRKEFSQNLRVKYGLP